MSRRSLEILAGWMETSILNDDDDDYDDDENYDDEILAGWTDN